MTRSTPIQRLASWMVIKIYRVTQLAFRWKKRKKKPKTNLNMLISNRIDLWWTEINYLPRLTATHLFVNGVMKNSQSSFPVFFFVMCDPQTPQWRLHDKHLELMRGSWRSKKLWKLQRKILFVESTFSSLNDA